MKPHLVFSAASFGYGPVSKALAIAKRLGPCGPVGFIGNGVALELAARSKLFHSITEASPALAAARESLADAKVMCCVMDPEFARLAHQQGVALHVVDSLFWMWDVPPPEYVAAHRYWVQDFFGVESRAGEVRPNPTVIGPILGRPEERSPDGSWVVNLGGGESPFGSLAHEPEYLETVLEPVFWAASHLSIPNLKIISGQNVIKWCRSRWQHSTCLFESVSQEEATRLYARASLVITSPGLTTTLECFRLGVFTFFLPPQNYSQWWILNYLRSASAAPGAVHWSDLAGDATISERMDETLGIASVRDSIRKGVIHKDAKNRIFEGLLQCSRDGLENTFANQRSLFAKWNSHGDGAAQVAEALTNAAC